MSGRRSINGRHCCVGPVADISQGLFSRVHMFLAKRGRTTSRYIGRQMRGTPIVSCTKALGAERCPKIAIRTGLLNLRQEDPLLERKCIRGFIVLIVAHATTQIFKPITTLRATYLAYPQRGSRCDKAECMQSSNRLRGED